MQPANTQQIPQYGQSKVKSPKCVILWSSASISHRSQREIQHKLLSKNVRLEQLDGAKPENKNLRNDLFDISHTTDCYTRGKYPQIFIKDTNNQIRFIGMEDDINSLIQELVDSDRFDETFGCCVGSIDAQSSNIALKCCNKQHLSLIVIGDLNCGKSTLCGKLLFDLGKMNETQLEQYRQTAHDVGNESSLFAFHMDTSRDERIRGVTIDYTFKDFETMSNHYTLIDSPGHTKYVKNAITALSLGDVAILMVSATKGAFEAAIAKGNHKKAEPIGHCRQLSRLCHASGIEQIIVCINKMDDISVNYAEHRYREIKGEIDQMLTRIGYKTKKIPFIPISSFKGDNLKDASRNMTWYKGFTVKIKKEKINGHTLMDALENVVQLPKRFTKKPFRMAIANVHSLKCGTVVTGRIEQGIIDFGQKVKLYPSGVEGKIKSIQNHHKTIHTASAGDCIGINIQIMNDKVIRKNDVMVIDDAKQDTDPPMYIKSFVALMFVPREHHGKLHQAPRKHNGKLREGSTSIIHIRTAKAACELCEINWKMGINWPKKVENPPYIEARDKALVVFKPKVPIIVYAFENSKPFGRVIAMDTDIVMLGKVTAIESTQWKDYSGTQNRIWYSLQNNMHPQNNMLTTLQQQQLSPEGQTQHTQQAQSMQSGPKVENENELVHRIEQQTVEISRITQRNKDLENKTLNEVIEYESTDKEQIVIRNEVKQKQCNIDNAMDAHVNRLKQWNDFSIKLQIEFDKIRSKQQTNDDDEKQPQQNKVSVVELLNSFINCTKALRVQQSRVEDIVEYVVALSKSKNGLKNSVKQYDVNATPTQQKYDELTTQYMNLKSQRETLQEQLSNIIQQINQITEEENRINLEKCKTLDDFNVSVVEKRKYDELLTKCKSLTAEYNEFETNIDLKTDEVPQFFKQKWDEHERLWTLWKVDDIIYWIKYMIYDNKIQLSLETDLDKVKEEMKLQKFTGKSLSKIEKKDLKLFGVIVFDDYQQIYKQIQLVITKYPDNDKCIRMDNQEIEGGMQMTKQVQIPEGFKCPISGTIMMDPIVYDGTTYDRVNFMEYVQKHKTLPGSDEAYDEDEGIFKNRKLKQKIDAFLDVHPQLTLGSTLV